MIFDRYTISLAYTTFILEKQGLNSMAINSVSNLSIKEQSNHSPKGITLVLAVLLLTFIAQNQSVQAKPPAVESKIMQHIVGKWKTPKGDIIGFYECGKQLCGRILKTTSGLKRDKHNSNPKLRNRPITGLTIMRSVKKSSIFKWHGYVYNVKDGQTYKGSLQLTSINTAKLTGCGAMGLCESVVWKKLGTNIARR